MRPATCCARRVGRRVARVGARVAVPRSVRPACPRLGDRAARPPPAQATPPAVAAPRAAAAPARSARSLETAIPISAHSSCAVAVVGARGGVRTCRARRGSSGQRPALGAPCLPACRYPCRTTAARPGHTDLGGSDSRGDRARTSARSPMPHSDLGAFKLRGRRRRCAQDWATGRARRGASGRGPALGAPCPPAARRPGRTTAAGPGHTFAWWQRLTRRPRPTSSARSSDAAFRSRRIQAARSPSSVPAGLGDVSRASGRLGSRSRARCSLPARGSATGPHDRRRPRPHCPWSQRLARRPRPTPPRARPMPHSDLGAFKLRRRRRRCARRGAQPVARVGARVAIPRSVLPACPRLTARAARPPPAQALRPRWQRLTWRPRPTPSRARRCRIEISAHSSRAVVVSGFRTNATAP